MLQTIQTILRQAAQEQLGGRFLDAEVLLGYVLGVGRSYLHAHPEYRLTAEEQAQFAQLVEKNVAGEPIAYLTHQREFWSLELLVTPATLIPRQETELLVELALRICTAEQEVSIADLGTGSGAIALAIAHERPNWVVHATDLSSDALRVAEQNAIRHQLKNIQFYEGFWCDALPKIRYDMIVSNPPYIASGDPYLHPAVLNYEPHMALFAEEDGLKNIKHIIHAATPYLKSGGVLLLEHGFQQAERIQKVLAELGYTEIKTERDLSGLERVTQAKVNF